MIRKTLTILSLIGLLLSVGLWGAQVRKPILIYSSSLPDNLPNRPRVLSKASESNKNLHSQVMHSFVGGSGFHSVQGSPRGKTHKVTRMIGCAFLADGLLIARIGTETLITDDQDQDSFYFYLEFDRSYMVGRMYSIPIWSIALVCALASGLLTIPPVLRRRKRKKLGLCLKCGYDLRASQDRCPECGAEFVSTGVER